MHFELLTLAGKKFDGEIEELQLRTADGDIGIKPHHEPLTAIVMPGPVTVKTKNLTEVFASYGGLLEVTYDSARLLADDADHAEDLIAAEIQKALETAKQLRKEAVSKHEVAKAEELVNRAETRLEVANLRRHHRPRHHTPKQP